MNEGPLSEAVTGSDAAVAAQEAGKEGAGALKDEKAPEGTERPLSAEAEAALFEPGPNDQFFFSDRVVEKIVGLAARDIRGILAVKGLVGSLVEELKDEDQPQQGIHADVNDGEVVIRIKMILEYGAPAPQIFGELRRHIAQQLFNMTGMRLVELNVEVVDVTTRDLFEKESRHPYAPFAGDPQAYGHGPGHRSPFRPPSGPNRRNF